MFWEVDATLEDHFGPSKHLKKLCVRQQTQKAGQTASVFLPFLVAPFPLRYFQAVPLVTSLHVGTNPKRQGNVFEKQQRYINFRSSAAIFTRQSKTLQIYVVIPTGNCYKKTHMLDSLSVDSLEHIYKTAYKCINSKLCTFSKAYSKLWSERTRCEWLETVRIFHISFEVAQSKKWPRSITETRRLQI